MRKKILYIMAMIMLQSVAFSQTSLDKYSYVVVPDTYSFLPEKDKYQLNSLTKYLFEKYGFNSYYQNELPNVNNCDGLRSDIEFESGFTYTRMVVVLTDCKGVEVYRSEEGASKLKVFRQAYQDALRKAFVSIEKLKVQQQDINVQSLNEAEDSSITKNSTIIKNTTKKVTLPIKTEDTTVENMQNNRNAPLAKYSNYEYKGANYLLKATATGFSLLLETDDGFTTIGDIELKNGGYVMNSNTGSTKASFTPIKDLELGTDAALKVFKFKN